MTVPHVLRGWEALPPTSKVSAPAELSLLLPSLPVLGLHRETFVPCEVLGAGPQGAGKGRIALEGAVPKPRAMIQLLGSSGWERIGMLSSEHSAVASPQNRSHMLSLSSLTV